MPAALDFPDLLRLIDERSVAFCEVVASAPSLDVTVPTCPDWTLRDLVHHLGEGRRAWAATVAAGPGLTSRAQGDGVPAPQERTELLAWMAESTQQLSDALRAAGPDARCWTWWDDSQSPSTSGAVARHQLQQMAVHTYDAQVTVGAGEPLSTEVALDGVEEFLLTCCATTSRWPHGDATVVYTTVEGGVWRVRLSAAGAQVERVDAGSAGPAALTTSSTASDLVMVFYGRFSPDALEQVGDGRLLDQLAAWDPSA